MARGARKSLVSYVLEQIGTDVARVVEVRNGWPAIVEMGTSMGTRVVALHAAEVTPMARQPYEWRFQNPLRTIGGLQVPVPVSAPPGTLPVLVGRKEVDGTTVLVCADGRPRLDTKTRFSVLFNDAVFRQGAVSGWAEYTSKRGDTTVGLRPPMFPLYVELLDADIHLAASLLAGVVTASGLTDDDTGEAAERARRVASRYVRDARFSKAVRAAYENRCAMCDLGLNLIAGAHIYPVGAPGSRDEVWNGIALCHNHHSAFDAHKIWIGPDLRLIVAPDYEERGNHDTRDLRFLRQTSASLRVPIVRSERPKLAMLKARYEFYEAAYKWAPDF